jgi:hypothetical protein
MTFMPLASVVVLTWSAPGTRGAAAGLAGVAATAAPLMSRKTTTRKNCGMRHLMGEASLYVSEKKNAAHGGSRERRQEANTGEVLFAVLLR